MLDAKLVLQHDEIPLIGPILHLLLELGTQSVESIPARGDLVVREDTDPTETGENAAAFFAARERRLGCNGGLEVILSGRAHAE